MGIFLDIDSLFAENCSLPFSAFFLLNACAWLLLLPLNRPLNELLTIGDAGLLKLSLFKKELLGVGIDLVLKLI